MRTIIDFSIMHEYNKNVLPRGDRLLSIAGLVDWKRFSPIGDGLYKNNTERGGRPNIDIIIMVKLAAAHPAVELRGMLRAAALVSLVFKTARKHVIREHSNCLSVICPSPQRSCGVFEKNQFQQITLKLQLGSGIFTEMSKN